MTRSLTPLGQKVARAFLRGALVAHGCSARRGGRAHPEYAGGRHRAARSSSPGCRGPARPRCTGCSPPTRRTRAWSCGSPRCRSRARPARPGPTTRSSAASRPPTSGTTSSIPSSWACTTSRPTRWRSAGSCCGSRCARSPTSAWRTCRRYSAWLRRAGLDRSAYRRHRRNLQLIGLPDRGRRWVLKNPSHLFALDALLRSTRTRWSIQTHREPRDRDRVRVQPRRAGVGRLVAEFTRRGDRPGPAGAVGRRARAVHGRCAAAHDPAQFFDVGLRDFVADPLGTVEAVYAHFGLPLSAAAPGAVRALHTQSAPGPRRAWRTATRSRTSGSPAIRSMSASVAARACTAPRWRARSRGGCGRSSRGDQDVAVGEQRLAAHWVTMLAIRPGTMISLSIGVSAVCWA